MWWRDGGGCGGRKSEAERAEEHKAALRKAGTAVVAAMLAAQADGFVPEFSFACDQFGRLGMQNVAVVKRC